jgi:hypothetical protein
MRRTVEIERDRGQGAVGKGALSGAAGTLLFLLRRSGGSDASITQARFSYWDGMGVVARLNGSRAGRPCASCLFKLY